VKVPDRAVVSIGPALSLAFLLGLIAAMELLGRSSRLQLGLIGAVAVAVTGPLSVIGLHAGFFDRLFVGTLRGLLAACAFALIYLGMIRFAALGEIALGLALFVGGGLAIYFVAQLRVRPPGPAR
jgi:mannose/fructose/N-acetylgalactosamine-specific phosphotransferase system component IID